MAKRNRAGAGAGAADEDDPRTPRSTDLSKDRDDDDPPTKGGGAAVIDRPGRPRFGFGKIGRFVREVVAELRKVNWPTRKELVTYSVVVVFFIAVMMAIIAGYDYAFARAVQWVFGS